MENDKLKKILEALGQRDQLEALGADLGEQPSEDMIGEPEPRMPADIPKLGEPAPELMDRKAQIMQELADRKMQVGQVPDEDQVTEEPEVQGLPDEDMKLKALQDMLMKMRK